MVKAGQIYAAKTQGRDKFVKVLRVKDIKSHQPYVLLRQVSKYGTPKQKSFTFRSTLTYNQGEWKLAPWYVLRDK